MPIPVISERMVCESRSDGILSLESRDTGSQKGNLSQRHQGTELRAHAVTIDLLPLDINRVVRVQLRLLREHGDGGEGFFTRNEEWTQS